MFSFWKKKSDPYDIYPSFTARMFASVIDVTLVMILFIPIIYFILPLFFGGTLPSQQFANIMVQMSAQMPDKSFIQLLSLSNEEFIKRYGYVGMVIEKTVQILILVITTLFFWIKTNSTPGKLLLSMRIVDEKTMGPPTSMQLFIRMLAYVVSIVPACLGIFYMAFNKKRRAWHDIIAGTVVIYPKKLQKLKSH